MIHEKIGIQTDRSEASMFTYILDMGHREGLKEKRPVVLICPGGGYRYTSDREAEPVAMQFNAMGFHSCVLRYSTEPAVFPTALLELSKAVSYLRERTEEWHIDTNKIIVAGFSAGGHLTASLGVFWDKPFLLEQLNLSADQIKPDGLILSYPVITSGAFAHKGSFHLLLGGSSDPALLEQVSLEKHVSAQTPPTFLWHTVEDRAVPVENSMLFANELLKNKVPIELHIYPKGGHGLSLGTEETKAADGGLVQPEVVNWIDMAGVWVRNL